MPSLNRPFIVAVIICLSLAGLALGLSHYGGGPYMIYALFLGMAIRSWVYTPPYKAGIDYTGKKILRMGVALLGARITFDEILVLGGDVIAGVIGATLATLVFGAIAGRMLGVGVRMGVLTGGATGICGASAAMAISSVLPQDKKLEEQTLFTVVGVNVLSTAAMILYPLLTVWMGYSYVQSGVFLGGSIHDVAQVVGAGFAVSEQAGNMATITKLLRVALLLPIVFALGGIVYWLAKRGSTTGQRGHANAPFPVFLLVFLILVAINSMEYLSFNMGTETTASGILAELSKWLLTMAVVALGMKTSIKSMLSIGPKSILLLILETLFIAILLIPIASYLV